MDWYYNHSFGIDNFKSIFVIFVIFVNNFIPVLLFPYNQCLVINSLFSKMNRASLAAYSSQIIPHLSGEASSTRIISIFDKLWFHMLSRQRLRRSSTLYTGTIILTNVRINFYLFIKNIYACYINYDISLSGIIIKSLPPFQGVFVFFLNSESSI